MVLQLAPIHGDKQQSMMKASRLLDEALRSDARLQQQGQKQQLGFLVLPEMAFTGYQFRGREEVLPLAEEAGKGETFVWCSSWAKRFRCGVCCGFPRLDTGSGKLFNSLMLVGPDGCLHSTYDKHFLYETDKTWAAAGEEGFKSVEWKWLDLQVGLGICMDINPKEFTAPWNLFEFANFHKHAGSKIILFCSAWCNRHPSDAVESPINGFETMNYWCNRLRPLIGDSVRFVVADRVGSEELSLFKEGETGKTTFCGSSCVIDLAKPAVLDFMDTDSEGAKFMI